MQEVRKLLFDKQNVKKEWDSEFLDAQYNNFLEYRQFYNERLKENKAEIESIDEQINQLKEHEMTTHQVFVPGGMSGYDDEKIEELMQKKYALLESNIELQKKVASNEESKEFLENIFEELRSCYSTQHNDKINLGLETLEIQEIERKRIARDLHDSTIQNLTALTHKIDLCFSIMEQDSIRAKLEMQTINHSLHNIICDMRRIIYNLRPMSFDDMGVDETIERFLSKIEESSGIKVNYCVTGICPSFKQVVSLSLFRIIQEACNNVIKHAEASKIDIHIDYKKDNLRLLVRDDGRGFEVNNLMDKVKENVEKKFGLSTIYERVHLLNGKIDITSEKELGTEITIRVPISKEICDD